MNMFNQGTSSSRRSGSRRASMSGSMMDLAGPDASGRRCCNKSTRATLVAFCLFLTILALVLTGIGIGAPAWLDLDITEYQQEWQIGLWRYCRRGGGLNEVGRLGIQLNEWICDVKDLTPVINPLTKQLNTQFAQNEHNETPVLAFLIVAFIFGFISMFALCCAYCNKYVPFCIIITNLCAMLCSVTGSLIYLISLQNINSRRYTSFNQVYFGTFGYAYYCTLIGAVAFIVSFIMTIPITILTFAWGKYKHDKHRAESMMDVDPSRKQLMGNTYNNSQKAFPLSASNLNSQYNMGNNQPIIVERDPDTHSIHSVRRFDEVDDEMRSAIKSAYSGQGSLRSQGGNVGGGGLGASRQNRGEIVDILNRDSAFSSGTPLFNEQGGTNFGNAKQQIAVMEKEPYRGTQSPIYGQATQIPVHRTSTSHAAPHGYLDSSQPYGHQNSQNTYIHQEHTTTRTESRI